MGGEDLQGPVPQLIDSAMAHLVQRGKRRSFPKGRALMRQGEPGETMFMIQEGRVRVERSHVALSSPLVLAELGPGELVGEMAVLEPGPRSATVTAMEETEAVELSREDLNATMTFYPEVTASLLTLLIRRLHTTDELAERLMRGES